MPQPNSPDTPLRGLDPAALLGLLGSERPPRPVVPGWEIENVIGQGGLGLVWRARLLSDGALAAVKVPRVADIDHIERLEHEAESGAVRLEGVANDLTALLLSLDGLSRATGWHDVSLLRVDAGAAGPNVSPGPLRFELRARHAEAGAVVGARP